MDSYALPLWAVLPMWVASNALQRLPELEGLPTSHLQRNAAPTFWGLCIRADTL